MEGESEEEMEQSGETLATTPMTTTFLGGKSWSSSSEGLATPSVPPLELDNMSTGMDFHQVTLSWKELSIYIQMKTSTLLPRSKRVVPLKRIINNVTGIVNPGTLLAIIGASGTGKSTLLNVLAHKMPPEVCLDGDILVNGNRFGHGISSISGHMYQEDLFCETLTLMEHLHFMARMKLDRRVRPWERLRRIQELISDLGLSKCCNTRISNLSGGERKRLSFASEILTDPPLLFCDEPTTGLDSYSAQRLVGLMREMTLKGRTILCTIHQPSSQIFQMFHNILILAEGGRTAYMGPTQEALQFFDNLGYACPDHFNPADHYIKILGDVHGHRSRAGSFSQESRAQGLKLVKRICDSYLTSSSASDMNDKVRVEFQDIDPFDFRTGSTATSMRSLERSGLGIPTVRSPNWFTKTLWLGRRSWLESIRNPNVHIIRILQKLFLAVLIGSCFLGIGNTNPPRIQDIQGAIFVLITESTFPIMYGVLHVFPLEMPLLIREVKGQLYRVDSYYLAKIGSLLPGFILDPVLFISISYWMVGLSPSIVSFALSLLVIVLTSNAAAACGCLFSAATDSVAAAFTILIPVDYILFVLTGLLINLDSLPVVIRWMKYLSWFMYSNEALSIQQWENVTNIQCTSGVLCPRNGREVLASYSFDVGHLPMDLIGLTSLILAFHFGAFIALLIKIRRK